MSVFNYFNFKNKNLFGSVDLGAPLIIMLDSGSPFFMLINNELVYIGVVATYNGGYSITHPSGGGGPSELQEKCNSLSDGQGATRYTINFYRNNIDTNFMAETGLGQEALPVYTPFNTVELKTNKNNLFVGPLANKFTVDTFTDPDTGIIYEGFQPTFPQYTDTEIIFNTCYGPDASTFNPKRISTGIFCADYGVTKNAVFSINQIKNTKRNYIGKISGQILKWTKNEEIYGSVGSPSQFTLTNTSIDTRYYEITIPLNSRLASSHFIKNGIKIVGGSEHFVYANKNKTIQQPPNYLQIVSIDNAFKRLFVKDLNGNMKNLFTKDPFGSRISIIRKNTNGYYDILKINNNSLSAILPNKALREISKSYDISNLNPSNKQQWADYLSLLKQYYEGTLTDLGNLSVINKIQTGNPVEIKYYSKQYVEDLISKLPRTLTQ
jgi:hypothetical protein